MYLISDLNLKKIPLTKLDLKGGDMIFYNFTFSYIINEVEYLMLIYQRSLLLERLHCKNSNCINSN